MLKDFPMDLDCDDELVWTGDSSGLFSVKSLVEAVSHSLIGPVISKTLIWKSLAPLRVQMFTWCCTKKKILTRVELRRRCLLLEEGDAKCPLCELEEESIDHLLVTCPVTWRL